MSSPPSATFEPALPMPWRDGFLALVAVAGLKSAYCTQSTPCRGRTRCFSTMPPPFNTIWWKLLAKSCATERHQHSRTPTVNDAAKSRLEGSWSLCRAVGRGRLLDDCWFWELLPGRRPALRHGRSGCVGDRAGGVPGRRVCVFLLQPRPVKRAGASVHRFGTSLGARIMRPRAKEYRHHASLAWWSLALDKDTAKMRCNHRGEA